MFLITFTTSYPWKILRYTSQRFLITLILEQALKYCILDCRWRRFAM